MRRVFAVVFLLMAAAAGAVAAQRASLDYNNLGRQYDSVSGVVYEQQKIPVYVGLALLCAVLGLAGL